jgi:glycosyltransferase involved in cell wall biosynthesis
MLISIVIPCYNVAHFIEKCLDSVYAQTYDEIEVILVDDGSNDDTVKCIERYLEVNHKKALLIKQENKGAAAARNRGLEETNGDYVQFLDADDWIKPSKIDAQVKIAKKAQYPDLIVGSYQVVNESGELILSKAYNLLKYDNLWSKLVATDLGNTCSNLFKAKMLQSGILWNEDLTSSQEYNLMFEILKKESEIVFDSNINTIIVRRREGSISTQNLKRSWRNYIELRKRILSWMQSHSQKVGQEIYQSVFDSLRMAAQHDLRYAQMSFKEMLPNGFKPEVSAATGRAYIAIYRFFGFYLTEKIWAMKNYFK